MHLAGFTIEILQAQFLPTDRHNYRKRIAGLFIISLCSLSCRPIYIYNTQAISKRPIGYVQCTNVSTMNNRPHGPVPRITNVSSVFLPEDPDISYVSSQTYLYTISRIRFSDFFTCVLATGLSLKPLYARLLLCLPVSFCLSMSLRIETLTTAERHSRF